MKSLKSADNNAVDKVSTNVHQQLLIKKREERLKDLIKDCPVTIQYGCHTIRLERNKAVYIGDGFSFRECGTEEGSDGITIRIR